MSLEAMLTEEHKHVLYTQTTMLSHRVNMKSEIWDDGFLAPEQMEK